MELQELKQKRKEFLEDTWKYYAEDVSRRAIEDSPYSKLSPGTSCKYKTKDGKKCAIGRYIPDEKYNLAIEGFGICHENMKGIITQEIINLGIPFLVKIQLLHDCDDNWNDYGLSGTGESMVGQIEEEFIL